VGSYGQGSAAGSASGQAAQDVTLRRSPLSNAGLTHRVRVRQGKHAHFISYSLRLRAEMAPANAPCGSNMDGVIVRSSG
jgi:hypothetical protein